MGFHRETPSPEVQTPNIDAIVASGIQLNRMYAYPFCAPSRAALMSGRMPRNSNKANIRGATYDGNHSEVGGQGVPRNQTTLSQMLAKANYWAAFAGKWDIGFATEGHIPAGRGYASLSPTPSRRQQGCQCSTRCHSGRQLCCVTPPPCLARGCLSARSTGTPPA